MNVRAPGPTPSSKIRAPLPREVPSLSQGPIASQSWLWVPDPRPPHHVWPFYNHNRALGLIIWQQNKKQMTGVKTVGMGAAQRPLQVPGKDYWAPGPSCWQWEGKGRYESKRNCGGRVNRTRWLFGSVGCSRRGGRADAEAWSPSDREPSYGQRNPPTLSPAPGSAPSSLPLCCRERFLRVFPDPAPAPWHAATWHVTPPSSLLVSPLLGFVSVGFYYLLFNFPSAL